MDGGAGNFDVSGAASEGKEEEGWIGDMIAPTLKGAALRLRLWDAERERKEATHYHLECRDPITHGPRQRSVSPGAGSVRTLLTRRARCTVASVVLHNRSLRFSTLPHAGLQLLLTTKACV